MRFDVVGDRFVRRQAAYYTLTVVRARVRVRVGVMVRARFLTLGA